MITMNENDKKARKLENDKKKLLISISYALI